MLADWTWTWNNKHTALTIADVSDRFCCRRCCWRHQFGADRPLLSLRMQDVGLYGVNFTSSEILNPFTSSSLFVSMDVPSLGMHLIYLCLFYCLPHIFSVAVAVMLRSWELAVKSIHCAIAFSHYNYIECTAVIPTLLWVQKLQTLMMECANNVLCLMFKSWCV